jgi:small subunit ribosomal protein S9
MLTAKKDAATGESLGTGRRKTAVARVRVKTGSGTITINGRPFEDYFPVVEDQRNVLDVLDATNHRADVDVKINCTGGGKSGQSGACRMGIARALCGMDEAAFAIVNSAGFLTRDSRMKERKKYGLRGARRGVQFSKR